MSLTGLTFEMEILFRDLQGLKVFDDAVVPVDGDKGDGGRRHPVPHQ